jgi:hypothetical protein
MSMQFAVGGGLGRSRSLAVALLDPHLLHSWGQDGDGFKETVAGLHAGCVGMIDDRKGKKMLPMQFLEQD